MCYSVLSLINDGNSIKSATSPNTGSVRNSPSPGDTSDYFSYGSPIPNSSGGLFDDDLPLPDLELVIPGNPENVFDQSSLDNSLSEFLEPDLLTCNNSLWYPVPKSIEPCDQANLPLVTTGNPSALCKVCGDKASGNHFGVLSCEACKSFFRRSIRTDARYSCRAGRCCVVDKQSRNRCQYCRLIKCITAGMKKETVQDERHPSGTKSKSAKMDEVESTPDVLSDEHSSAGSTPNTPSSAAGNFKVSDIFGSDNLLDGHNSKDTPTQAVQLDTFLGAMTACAIKLVEWARHIPAFSHLNFEDQVRLLKASWCDLYILHLAVHNGANPDTLVLGGGLTCKREQIGDPEVSHLIDRISSEVSSWFESLSTEPVEINCLKGILLFNPAGSHLSCEAKKEVEMYQEQILAYLENHSKSTHSTISQRFSKLLLRLGSIQSISKEMMQYLEVQQTLGHTHMDKLLLELFDSH